jgi:hypothetical protein
MELGLFTQFFPSDFQLYGHLATQTYCIKIWKETQPLGVHLWPAPIETWLPEPLAVQDISITELAMKSYNKKGDIYYQPMSSTFTDYFPYGSSHIWPINHSSLILCTRTPSISPTKNPLAQFPQSSQTLLEVMASFLTSNRHPSNTNT